MGKQLTERGNHMYVGDLVKCHLRDQIGMIVEVLEDGTRHINHPYRVRFLDGNTWDCSHLYLNKIQ